jgi:hypothetical protein
MQPMTGTVFFLAIVCLLYLSLALRLKGSAMDRVVILGLRSLFFLCLLTLFLSPQFEMVYQEWKDPVFVVLEDDSPSVKYQKSSALSQSILSQLESLGTVIRRKFSESSGANPYSISAQLDSLSGDGNTRGTILLTDGNEVGAPYRGQSQIPVFTLGSGSESFRDLQISLKTFPRQVFLDQTMVFRGEILSNAKPFVSGVLRVQIDGKVILEERHDLQALQSKFSFSHQFVSSGEKQITIDFECLEPEKIKANNQIQFYLNVNKEKTLVLVFAKAPNRDLAFYLRELRADPALKVQVRYLNARMPGAKPQGPLRSPPALIFIHHLAWDQVEPILGDAKLMDIPRLFILGLETQVLASYQKKSIFDFQGLKPFRPRKLGSWDYILHKEKFPAFQFYEHEGFEKTILSSFPLLKELGPKLKMGPESILGFEMEIDSQSHPLVIIQRKTPVQALINSSDLSSIAFSPLVRVEHQKFFSRLVRSLSGWLMDADRVQGLDISLPNIHLVEGETFEAQFRGPSRYRVSLKKRQGSRLFSASLPLKLARKLRAGNYELEVSRDSKVIKSFQIHVGFDPQEFRITGRNHSYLEDIASRTGGRYLGFKSVDLAQELPGNLLQKKLELRHEKVDLQENIFVALFMLSLVSGEWIYRYIKRLV